EKRRDGGKLLGPAHAAHRHGAPGLHDILLEADIRPLAVVAPLDLIADDHADMQRIAQHVVRRALLRHRLGQRHLCGAADRGRRAVGAGRLGADVEDTDDAAPFPLFHLWHQDAAEADLGEEFEVEIPLPLFVGDRFRRAAYRLAGIVDKDIDLAEFRIGLLAGGLDGPRLRDVAADREYLALAAAAQDLLLR